MAGRAKYPSYCYEDVGEAIQMQPRAVFVGYNLPKWITKDRLLQHFHSFRDKLDLGRSTIIDAPGNRHGKVFFTDDRAVDQAIEQLNGTSLQGKFRIHVKPWVRKAAKNLMLLSEEGGKSRKKSASVNERRQVQSGRGQYVSSTISTISQPIADSELDRNVTDLFPILSSDDFDNASVIAWVGYDLPMKVTERSLREHFHAVSDQIEQIEFNQTQKFTRVAYMQFTSAESLEQAVSTYNETMMECGQKIWVSKKGEKPIKHTKNPNQSDMSSHRQPQIGTPPRPQLPSNTSPLGVPYPYWQCVPQMGPQYRRSCPPFQPGPGERMPFPPIRPLSSDSHPRFAGPHPHPPPVPCTYPPGHLPGAIATTKHLDMSSALYQFITKRFEKDAERAGVRIQFSDGSLVLEGPEPALSAFYESCISPLKDGSMPITGDQWNLLVTAREDGTLFQNIVKPYQYNPNVLIDKKEDPFMLVIVGYKDAVESARESFLCKLGRKTNTTGFGSEGTQLYATSRSEGHLSGAKEQRTAFLTDSISDSQNVQIEPLLWTLITSRHMSTLEAEDCKVSYSKESPGVFEVSGKKGAVQFIVTKIKAIEAYFKSKLCCETVEVDKSFQLSLNEQSILSFVKSVEEKCFVKIDLPRSNTVLSEVTGPTSNPQIILSRDKAGSSDVPDAVYQWEFMDDDGKFQPFEQTLSSQVENEYLMNPKSRFRYSRGKWSYSVNLDSMTQTNKETRKTRTIKRSMYIPNWYWEDDDGAYHPYSQAVSVMIDQIQNGTIENLVQIDGRCYKFDFSAKHQVNLFTGHKRKIRPRTRHLTIQVNGCIEDVRVAKKKITEFFKNIEKEDKFPFPLEFSSKMKPLIATLCTRHSVKVSLQYSSKDVSVILLGWEKAVVLVKEQCMKGLLDLVNEHIQLTQEHPCEWEPDDNRLVLKEVLRTSQEFQKVLTRMHETMPNVTINKLERIQNQWLWEKYAQHRTRIHKKNQGKIGEKDLFHGTRTTDPSLIYRGEEGFDMRFGSAGMWGVGNYFAVDAHYSHSYAHVHVIGGMRQMFLTRVITGESYCCEPDSSLKMPPAKPSARNFAGERYDSVTGTTRGSRVFIIYDNLKAYPLYLITYQCQTQLQPSSFKTYSHLYHSRVAL